jgi:glycosyltransferase involved in cell wall biosynthesis
MALISIITVTFNAEKFLERTLLSIQKQTLKDFEVLVIDGKSTDNTLTIARKYDSLIATVISEKDNGIYDAMNKGLDLAKGDFVWFINAGDEIADEHVVQKIAERTDDSIDLIYGDSLLVDLSGKVKGKRSELTPHRLKQNINWKDLKYGMLVSHQSLLVRKKIAPHYKTDNLSADVDWEINAFKAAQKTLFLEFPLSRFLEGGVSNRHLKRSLKDRYLVLQDHFGWFSNFINHLYILFRGMTLVLKRRRKYW